MLEESRRLIVAQMDDGVLRGRVINSSSPCSTEGMVEVVCLMTYYFMSHNDIFQECLTLFEWCQDLVREKFYEKADQNTDGEYGIEMALSHDFIGLVEREVHKCTSEAGVQSVVDKIMKNFFNMDDDDDEGLSFDEVDHEDDFFLDTDLIEVDDADDDR